MYICHSCVQMLCYVKHGVDIFKLETQFKYKVILLIVIKDINFAKLYLLWIQLKLFCPGKFCIESIIIVFNVQYPLYNVRVQWNMSIDHNYHYIH